MKSSVQVLMAAAWLVGVLVWVGAFQPQAAGQAPAQAPAQAGPPPAQTAPPGGRGFAPGTESGFATYQTRCTGCHGNPSVERATTPDALRAMTPERIYEALAPGGVMATEAADLTDPQKRALAEFMSGRPMGSAALGDARQMPNQCRDNPPLAAPASGPSWNGWGVDLANTRFQPAEAARLTPAQVPQLRLKWVFGYPAGVSANAPPAVASGRVFVGSDNGFAYALDAKTGCVYWSFESGSIIRNAVTFGTVTGHEGVPFAVFFGDGHAGVYALDAQTGRQLWKATVDPHFVARITGGTKYYNGRLIVPVSSSEEFRSGNANYSCCTARGSVVALDANTGAQIWKAWVVPDEPKPYRTQPNGVVLYKPAGGAVWNSPTIDPVRNAVYFGTGDATTDPPAPTTDGIMAVDLDTGALLWSYQATEGDVFMGGCNGPDRSEACPEPMGPDMDIGNSPILTTLPDGRRALLAGTKSGDVFALDPDDNGRLLYRVNPAGEPINGTGRGGRAAIVWGGAADDRLAYYGLGAAGLAAVRPATGERVWLFTPPQLPGGGRGGSLGAAATTTPGVVFQGSGDGTLYAVSAATGQQIWEFDTAQDFDTVNGIQAHGGAISVSGAVVVDGMLYIGSGYAVGSGASAGNVLLAFGVE
jgi:polyvinyl alcohol dehydrogenase (cytochrome)